MKIGILGGGQLAQMMAQAKFDSSLEFTFYTPQSDACAAQFGELLCAPYDDEQAQAQFFNWADVVTFESENIPQYLAELAESQSTLHPSSTILAVSADRLLEKSTFQKLGIATAHHAAVDSLEDLHNAVKQIGLPAILKTRRFGYDGKGQFFIREMDQLADAWASCGNQPCILEAVVKFEREISIIGARSRTGETQFYALAENWHRDGILRLSLVRESDPFQKQAEAMLSKVMEEFAYVGILTLELFQCEGKLIANEMAPRVHNSGHWSIELTKCSQFENHLRAVCGLPLGNTQLIHPAAMINLIGQLPKQAEILAVDWAHPHWYGKVPQPNRKVGHVTVANTDPSSSEFDNNILRLLEMADETEIAQKYRATLQAGSPT